MARRSSYLDRKARDYIISQLHDNGETDKEQVKALIRPHFSFDPEVAEDQALGRCANRLIASARDAHGDRTCFIIPGQNIVVNVEKSRNLAYIKTVEAQLSRQLEGVQRSHRKAARRVLELEGQLSIFNEFGRREEIRGGI